jgi:outer membrane lipoprotein-sorting protein
MQFLRLARTRHARWGVPAAAVIVTGGAIAVSAISGVAQASPSLPARTPAQLLADIAATRAIPPLTGTVVETTSLGLPGLPQAGGPASPASLLTGSHTVKVYYRDAQHYRLALPQAMTETDLIRDGSTAWSWDSAANRAVRLAIPEGTAGPAGPAAGQLPPLTPQQAASEALAAVGKTTAVSVDSTLMVAGQPAYQLVLAPRDARSTIGSVRIAIDGATGVPLRLQVFARGGAAPAFQVAYTAISYTAPPASAVSFTAPPGAKVTVAGKPDARSGAHPAHPDAGFGSYGTAWLTVLQAPRALLTEAMSPAGAPSSSSTGSSGAFGGDTQTALGAFLRAAKPVSGSWGSGQLLHTSLINVLFTGDDIYIGAVDPAVLEAAVGHATPAAARGR